MKTLQIARGIAGVLSLVGVTGLVGCSAETGSGEPEQIGASSAALVADVLDNIPTTRIGAASCVIHDTHANPAVDLLVVAGGHELTPTDRSSIDVYRPGTGWSTLGINLAVARSNLSGMQIPGHTNECIFVGGDQAGTSQKTTDRLTLNLSTGVFSIASTATQDLNVARTNFPISQCGSDKIIAFGDDNSLEVYDPAGASGAGAWTKPANSTIDLSSGGTGAPFSGGYQKQAMVAVGTNASTTYLNFALIGGFDGSNAIAKVDLIKMPSACLTSNGQIKATRNAVSLATARQLAVAFQKDPANNDDVLVTGGDSSSVGNTPLSSTELLDVDFTTTFASATKSSGTALPAVTRAPKLARLGATGAFYLIGGEDNSGTSSSVQTLASVYHYNPGSGGSWTTETLNDDTSSDVQDRSGLVAEYLDSTGKIFSTAGQRIVNGTASTIVTMQKTN